MKKQDDTFLARWLNNELTSEELKAFEATEDFALYNKILLGTTQLEGPSFDEDEAFIALKDKRANRNTIKKSSTNWFKYGIAASVIFLIGFISYSLLFQTTVYTTGIGEQLSCTLPDGSTVILNAKSSLEVDTHNWNEDRKLSLKGEAFFDVEKGKTFTVSTKEGNVTVLGTEFTVNAYNNYFEVACYEGKVSVLDNHNNKTTLLIPNQSYRNIENTISETATNSDEPLWLKEQSIFKSIPIKHVFKALEKQYGIKIKYNKFDDTILFTGAFPNNNQQIALETVLKSVNLDYTVKDNSIILQD